VVTYWDSSALVPLLLKELTSDSYRSRARETQIVTWWGSALECTSAIQRRAREGEAGPIIAAAYRNLEELVSGWREIHPSESLRRTAIRLLKTTPLRSADALHLAAALLATNFDPPQARFFTQDTRLKAAAEREGFVIDY
jgi:hypothetical protein